MGREYGLVFDISVDYPYEKPSIQIISIDLDSISKEQFVEQLLSSCNDFIGMAMTFVLSSALIELLNTFHEAKLSKMKTVTDVLICPPFYCIEYDGRNYRRGEANTTKGNVTYSGTKDKSTETERAK